MGYCALMNVLEQVAQRAQAVKVLTEAGLIRPMRPEKVVHMAATMLRWGPTPASGYMISAVRRPDQVGLIDELGTLTFREIHERTNALANAWSDLGIGEGAGGAGLCRTHHRVLGTTAAPSR